MDQYILDFIGLLDLDAYSYRVYRGLDEDTLVLVASDGQGCEQDLRRRLGLDLGDIVALRGLRREVGETEGGSQTASDALKVWAKGL